VHQMMMVVGEEGTSLEDFVIYLKSEFIDAVYLQQNAFDPVDAATIPERQKYVMNQIKDILESEFQFSDNEEARTFFYDLRQNFIDWNYSEWQSDAFKSQEKSIKKLIEGKKQHA
jgi:V/A-type H+-transporting ATPase subunit A